MSRALPEELDQQWALADRLARQLNLNRGDQPEDPGWNLVHNLASIEDSCRVLTEQLFPRLVDPGSEDLNDILTDIGVELDHLVYHVGVARRFAYLGVQSARLQERPTGDYAR
jgi:hypothetical protein